MNEKPNAVLNSCYDPPTKKMAAKESSYSSTFWTHFFSLTPYSITIISYQRTLSYIELC